MSIPKIFDFGNFCAIILVRIPVPHARSSIESPLIFFIMYDFHFLSCPSVAYFATESYVDTVSVKNFCASSLGELLALNLGIPAKRRLNRFLIELFN